jgi:FixJ family two-component response regulator
MAEKATVFVVDDDPAVRDAVSVFLRICGFAVVTFDSAEAFLGAAGVRNRCVLVLDQRMDGMSGLELQAELRQRGVRLPTVFITGHGDAQMYQTAIQEGAVDVLEKPFSNKDLLASVEKALAPDQVHGGC